MTIAMFSLGDNKMNAHGVCFNRILFYMLTAVNKVPERRGV